MLWAMLCFVSWVCFWFLLLLYYFVFMPLDWFICLHVKFSIICVILSMFLGCYLFIVWLLKETCRTEFKGIPIKFSTYLWIRSSLHPSFPFERLVVDSIFFILKLFAYEMNYWLFSLVLCSGLIILIIEFLGVWLGFSFWKIFRSFVY